MKTLSKLTACAPNTFEKRRRTRRANRSGRTLRRKVWSLADGSGKAKRKSGCPTALPDGYGPCKAAVQEATQPGSAAAAKPVNRRNLASVMQRRINQSWATVLPVLASTVTEYSADDSVPPHSTCQAGFGKRVAAPKSSR